MGADSTIAWTDATYNPWRGCDKVSPGCAHCYMFTDQRRYGRDPSVVVRCSDNTFYAPLRQKRWRELPVGSLVFTCSWSDWFHPDADAWRDDAWDVIRKRPDLRWQILTKRPENILDRLPADWGDGWPHVWLGVSIENRRFVYRADLLRQVPAQVRFISAEPLLGPLVHDGCRLAQHGGLENCWSDQIDPRDAIGRRKPVYQQLDLTGIDWLIVGGESGAHARPLNLMWAHDLLHHARWSGTAVFMKQLGERWATLSGTRQVNRKGEDPAVWPPSLRVREFPVGP